MSMLSIPNLLENLVQIGERQGATEAKAASMICSVLRKAGIEYVEQSYRINVPLSQDAQLTVDGKSLDCAATSFSSGTIPDKEIILSSAMPMAESPNLPNINFNPYCPLISKANHYREPAIAVSHDVLREIMNGKQVRAEICVSIETQEARNLIIGNVSNPAIAIFTHYDSIGPGANDNASGIVAVIQAILEKPELKENAVCILSGAEELSDELPYYWGAGYRRFQEKYGSLLKNVEKILVVDSVGQGTICMINDARIVRRAFPLHDMESLLPKIQLISGSLDSLMTVYHSSLDTTDAISFPSVSKAVTTILHATK